MENNVFISHVSIETQPKSNLKILNVYYYDKNGNEDKFCSSKMTEAEIENYKKNILKAINCKNWTQAKHTPILEDCSRVCDDNGKMVGLNTRFGFIGKAKIDIYKK